MRGGVCGFVAAANTEERFVAGKRGVGALGSDFPLRRMIVS
jgi:hypothetical protein